MLIEDKIEVKYNMLYQLKMGVMVNKEGDLLGNVRNLLISEHSQEPKFLKPRFHTK